MDLVAVTVQIYFWRQQHTSHHAAALGEAKGFLCLYRFFGVPSPRRTLASGGKVSHEGRVLIQELDGNLLHHRVKFPTSNENTKKPRNPKPKETNQQKTFLFLFLSSTWLRPGWFLRRQQHPEVPVPWELLPHPKWRRRGWPLLKENAAPGFG